MRRSSVFKALPRQPHWGLAQERRSAPKSSIASVSESEVLEHFRSRMISWPSLGQTKTNRYALFTGHYTTLGRIGGQTEWPGARWSGVFGGSREAGMGPPPDG